MPDVKIYSNFLLLYLQSSCEHQLEDTLGKLAAHKTRFVDPSILERECIL